MAKLRGADPEETILHLMFEDKTRIGVVFFLMREDNVRKQLQLPWVVVRLGRGVARARRACSSSRRRTRAPTATSRGCSADTCATRSSFLSPRPIRRLSGLPATNLGLDGRGLLKPGMFADVVVFDPAKIADHATFEQPHQYATGMRHVFVNGVQVLKDGEHTGALPGRALKGPGATR